MKILEKNNKLGTILSIVLLVGLVFAAAKYFRNFEGIILKAGVAGPIVAILIFGILAATPITTDPLTAITGIIFGPILGILVSWMGNNLAAMVEYFLGTHLGKVTNFKKFKKKLPFGLSRFPIYSPSFLLFGRLVPGYGGKVVSIMAGMYHVPMKTYLWVTALTNFLGSVLLSFGGYNLIKLLKL